MTRKLRLMPGPSLYRGGTLVGNCDDEGAPFNYIHAPDCQEMCEYSCGARGWDGFAFADWLNKNPGKWVDNSIPQGYGDRIATAEDLDYLDEVWLWLDWQAANPGGTFRQYAMACQQGDAS